MKLYDFFEDKKPASQ